MLGNDKMTSNEGETRALNLDDPLSPEQIRIQREKDDLLKEFLGNSAVAGNPVTGTSEDIGTEAYNSIADITENISQETVGATEAASSDTTPEAASSDTTSEAASSDTTPEAASSDTTSEAASSDTTPEAASSDTTSENTTSENTTKTDASGVTKESLDEESLVKESETKTEEMSNNNYISSSPANTTDAPVVVTKFAPLPKFGGSGMFIPVVVILTICGVILGHIRPVTYGIPTISWIRYTYIGFSVILLFIGITMLSQALSDCQLFTNLMMGKLITTGIYSKTRNPMYGGIIFICTAVLFFSGNTFMYILPLIYWGLLTIMMKKTEEPLLTERFGNEYLEYMENTYRFVPLPKKKLKEKGEIIDKLP
ncbi:MAG: hypothetical protein K6E10_06070 [Eubacterium sp.]|nr:hypothetical protein [Eubacterium sp.]